MSRHRLHDSKTITCQQMEQAARSLAMLATLENNSLARLERCIDVLYFLGRFQTIWQSGIRDEFRVQIQSGEKPLFSKDHQITPEDYLYLWIHCC